jgi:nicotinate-nucleotide pyrophosphorylase (carboxylating)
MGEAIVVGREPFVLSGSRAFRRVFELLDSEVRVESLFGDGARLEANMPVFALHGSSRTILAGERTALNLLQRLSGIATLTRRMADALEGTSCRLLDTRKTTPLWRFLEKAAVAHGGGANHRYGLSDGILIKDNHVVAAGGVREAVRRARSLASHLLRIEVEVDTLGQLEEALDSGADIVLLDNFSLDMMRRAVERNHGKVLLEVSGGVALETVRAIAETGVDFVSCGALTHSARAIDIGLDFSV